MQTKKYHPIEVSVIVPCYNEAETIHLLLEALLKQSYPINDLEVVISDAMSEDNTRTKIQEFSQKNPVLKVVVVDNPKRTIPSGVNAAAQAAKGKFLVRMDAHSVPDKNYIHESVRLLKENVAENVGGVWEIQAGENTCIARAIAASASHPLGAGDALYRIANKAAYVETVPYGAFSKATFEKVGRFDETLLANEDYEFNTRIRLSGGRIWLDPRIRCKYYARKNLQQLAKQYWRYGFWKYKMLKRYPKTLRWRQAIPPVFTFGILLFTILSTFSEFARIILASGFGLYISVLAIFSIMEALKRKDICYLKMIFALMVMHFCWGSGFLYSVLDFSKEA